MLYVIQLERQSGEWQFVGGYAGEAVTDAARRATFAPDRGLTRVDRRAGRRTRSIRTAASRSRARSGRTADGVYAKAEYSQAAASTGAPRVAGVLIGGEADDFLGQYRRNSHVALGASL